MMVINFKIIINRNDVDPNNHKPPLLLIPIYLGFSIMRSAVIKYTKKPPNTTINTGEEEDDDVV